MSNSNTLDIIQGLALGPDRQRLGSQSVTPQPVSQSRHTQKPNPAIMCGRERRTRLVYDAVKGREELRAVRHHERPPRPVRVIPCVQDQRRLTEL